MISVNFGSGNDDLKAIMAKAGAKIKSDDKLAPGEPNLIMFLKLANYMLKKGNIHKPCGQQKGVKNGRKSIHKGILNSFEK